MAWLPRLLVEMLLLLLLLLLDEYPALAIRAGF